MTKFSYLTSGIGAGLIALAAGNRYCKNNFPPEALPEMPPQPGYKVFGYMGCPSSKVQNIQQRNRNLFFTNDISTAQFYAKDRVSLLSQLQNEDKPVVLQLEIKEDFDIQPEQLWRDPTLSKPVPPYPVIQFVSTHPAVPPEVQKEADLQVRIHHVVDSSLQQRGGHAHRALKSMFNKKP